MVPILVIGGLVLIYISSYVLNKRTPAPANGSFEIDTATCNACSNFTCSHKGDE